MKYYFAYGSNMSLARLRARVPSARRLGAFELDGHELRFHQKGGDGSAKCDAYQTDHPEHCVVGAVFEIDPAEQCHLDRAEDLGKGYEIKTVGVKSADGQWLEAITYYAIDFDHSLKPFSWYVNHVLVGAREIGMPEDHLSRILAVEALDDHDTERDRLERGIYGTGNG